MVRLHGIREIEAELDEAYRGHHQYDWVRPRRTWLDATCPVYIDLEHFHRWCNVSGCEQKTDSSASLRNDNTFRHYSNHENALGGDYSDFLAKLEIYDESGLPCIYLVAKRKFIHDVMTEKVASAIATRFYPLLPDDSV
jgi:hypothetical protein